ncbi:unnamed protein product [Cochlearia groenlandica]
MMFKDLPSDLIEKILLKVPATSLGRSQFTCKHWNSLVKDPRFIKKHFGDNLPRQSLIVTLTNDRVYSMSLNLQNNVEPTIGFTRKLNLIDTSENQEVDDIYEVFHCDGLLLCTTTDKRLVVWNPCTGQNMWLEPRDPDTNFLRYFLGYKTNKKLCPNYKILRLLFNNKSKLSWEIYEFCSNSWKVVIDDDVTPNCVILFHYVSLNGNTYWIVKPKNSINTTYYLLLKFDFSTEKFRFLPFPCKSHGIGKDGMNLEVVREEQLSVLHWIHHREEMDIWVSTKIETTHVTWSKFLKVGLNNIISLWPKIDARFFIDYDMKVVVCCYKGLNFAGNLVHVIGEEENKFRDLSLGESTELFSCLDMFSYVPSLVRFQESINVTSIHKRKRT